MNQNDQYEVEYQKYLQKIGMAPTILALKYKRFNNQSNKPFEEKTLENNEQEEIEPIFQTINSITILNNQCKSVFRAKKYPAVLQNFKEDDEKLNQKKSQSHLYKNITTSNSHFTTLLMNEDATSNNSQLSNPWQYNLKLDVCSPHTTQDFTSNNILQLPKFLLDSIESFEKNGSSSSIIQEGINLNDLTQNHIELSSNMDLRKQTVSPRQNQENENQSSCNNFFIDEQPQQYVYPDQKLEQTIIQIQKKVMVEKQQQTQELHHFSLSTQRIKTEKQKQKQRKSRKINKKKRREKIRISSQIHQNMIKFIPNEIFRLDQQLIGEQEQNFVQEIIKEQQIENPVCKLLKKIILGFSRQPQIFSKKNQNLLGKEIMIKRKINQKTQDVYKNHN